LKFQHFNSGVTTNTTLTTSSLKVPPAIRLRRELLRARLRRHHRPRSLHAHRLGERKQHRADDALHVVTPKSSFGISFVGSSFGITWLENNVVQVVTRQPQPHGERG